jgi:hypothetical protein
VIHQSLPYYGYGELAAKEKELARQKERSWRYEPVRRKRLLFRLVNYAQPAWVVDAGRPAASALYLQAAKAQAGYTAAARLDELFLEADTPVDFLYLHDYRRPDFVEQVFDLCADRSCERSLFVVEGIGYTPAMRALWRRMQQDRRTGITFDLFELGLIFFDGARIKQHYLVNY